MASSLARDGCPGAAVQSTAPSVRALRAAVDELKGQSTSTVHDQVCPVCGGTGRAFIQRGLTQCGAPLLYDAGECGGCRTVGLEAPHRGRVTAARAAELRRDGPAALTADGGSSTGRAVTTAHAVSTDRALELHEERRRLRTLVQGPAVARPQGVR